MVIRVINFLYLFKNLILQLEYSQEAASLYLFNEKIQRNPFNECSRKINQLNEDFFYVIVQFNVL